MNLSSIAGAVPRSRVRVGMILHEVRQHFGLQLGDLVGISREKAIVRARFAAVALISEFTSLSSTEIGQRLGGRDHTTILAARRRVERLYASDPDFAADLDELRVRVRHEAAIYFVRSTGKPTFISQRNQKNGAVSCVKSES